MTMNRRDFLVSTAVMTAGATVRGLASPNDTVRMAVVGCGGRGQSHVTAWSSMPNVEIVALCDVDQSHIGRQAEVPRGQGCSQAGRPTSTCGSCSRTRTSTRCRSPRRITGTRSRRSGRAGRQGRVRREAVLAQHLRVAADRRRGPQIQPHRAAGQPEPLVTGAARSRAADAQRRARRGLHGARPLLQVARHDRQVSRWSDESRREVLRSLSGGRPEPCYDTSYLSNVDYDLWLGPAPKRPFNRNRFHYNWHWFWDTGNGDLGNQGIHEVDIARWGLGVTHPTKVSAIGGKFMFDDDQETPNTITASYEFDVNGKKKMMTFEVRHWISPHEAGIDEREAGQHDRQPVLRFQGLPGHRQLQQVLLVPRQGPEARADRHTEGRALGQLHRRGAQPQA